MGWNGVGEGVFSSEMRVGSGVLAPGVKVKSGWPVATGALWEQATVRQTTPSKTYKPNTLELGQQKNQGCRPALVGLHPWMNPVR